MIKAILVPIANGSEELEAVTIIDILRRAGVNVHVASVDANEIRGANGIRLGADSLFKDAPIGDFDGIVLPGGTEAAERFFACTELKNAIEALNRTMRLVAAICASPALVLAPMGLLQHKKATCYPSLKNKLPHFVNDPVVDQNLVTSQGPATALPFALKLTEILMGKKVATEVAQGILHDCGSALLPHAG